MVCSSICECHLLPVWQRSPVIQALRFTAEPDYTAALPGVNGLCKLIANSDIVKGTQYR